MSRYLFVLLISISIWSCKEEKIWLSDKLVEAEGRISFMETPKIIAKNSESSDTLTLYLKKKQEENDNYRVETYVDGELHETIIGFFRNTYLYQNVKVPPYGGKDTVTFESRLYMSDKLVQTETVPLIYLPEGEEAAFVDYTHEFGVLCGKVQFFEDEELYAIPAAGDYDINLKTKINTYRIPDGRLAMAVSYDCKNIKSHEGNDVVPIPAIASDTFYFPKEFQKKEGIEIKSHMGYFGLDNDDVGKYLAYALRKDAAGFYKKVVAKDGALVLIEDTCIYEPHTMTLHVKHYPGSVSNQYLSLR